MQWLITTKANTNLEELESRLAEWGCERTGSPPIPLGEEEQVIEVSGPANLPEKVRREGLNLKVNPSSSMTLY
jgi:hypothetical protein